MSSKNPRQAEVLSSLLVPSLCPSPPFPFPFSRFSPSLPLPSLPTLSFSFCPSHYLFPFLFIDPSLSFPSVLFPWPSPLPLPQFSCLVLHNGMFSQAVALSDLLSAPVTLHVDRAMRIMNTRLHSAGHLLDAAVETLKLPWIGSKGPSPRLSL